MLLEFQQLEERDARLAARVTQVIGHLLRHQFVHTDDRGSPGLLETLRRPAAVSLVAGYFDIAGYRLVIRESEGWAGLLPDLERMSAPRMRIDETLVLLVLRRLWEEGVQDGDVLPRGAILLTLNEAYAAYEEVVARGRRPALPATAFREIVQQLERRAIVNLGDFDDEAQDMELTIRPIVAAVAGDESLARLDQLLLRADVAKGDEAEA